MNFWEALNDIIQFQDNQLTIRDKEILNKELNNPELTSKFKKKVRQEATKLKIRYLL